MFLSYSFLIQIMHSFKGCILFDITALQKALIYIGGIAQLVEHLPCKQGVIGSNPITSTNGFIAQLVRAHA